MSKKAVAVGLIVAFICLSVAVVLFFVISHMIKTDPSKARLVRGRMPVTLVSAKLRDFSYVIGASGQTQEFEKVSLTAKVNQPVEAVNIKIGDIVRKDQVLVEFQRKLLKAVADQARSALSRAKSELEYSKLNYHRFFNLYKQNLIAKVELEEADQRVKNAEFGYFTAVRELEKALQDLSYANALSPTTGMVLDNPITVGEIPKLEQPLVSIGIIDKIFMLAKVAEEKISYVHLKMSAEVLFDSFPNDPIKGEITKIDPNTDPKTRTFIAYIEIPNKDLKLTPGLTGFARINYTKNSLVVPSISVINPVGENATVFVVDADSIAHIKRVKTGLSAGGQTEILEGLKDGDKVAFAGIQALKEGDKVEVIENKL
jgi:RND family efflux transporter MFP subunit